MVQKPLRLQRYNKKMIYANKKCRLQKNAEKFAYVEKKQYLCSRFVRRGSCWPRAVNICRFIQYGKN